MHRLRFDIAAPRHAAGDRPLAIAGVVGSGNLEVMVERGGDDERCVVEIATPLAGFDAIWGAVVQDFVERRGAGGLRIAINDGGARPDTVALRLAQALRQIERSA